jgi:hypothetical protein
MFLGVYLHELPTLTNSAAGSIFGNGDLEISIPGENMYETLSCSWGLSIGFYLLLISIGILIIAIVLDIKKRFEMRKI